MARQPAVQALIRWDPATFADRELAERAELRFPPAARMASVTGPRPPSMRCWLPPPLPAATPRCSGRCRLHRGQAAS